MGQYPSAAQTEDHAYRPPTWRTPTFRAGSRAVLAEGSLKYFASSSGLVEPRSLLLFVMFEPPSGKEIGLCRRGRTWLWQVQRRVRSAQPHKPLDAVEAAFAVREIDQILPKLGAIQCLSVPFGQVFVAGDFFG